MSRWTTDEPDDTIEESDEDELEGDWELDPNDPTHPDHDLSISAGYGGWVPTPKPVFLRRGFVLFVTIFVIIGLMIPLLLRLTY